jgi:hypothetical protein
VFRPFLRRELFDTCLVCKRTLLEDGTHYVIEKAIRGEEVIFEYAMCEDCWDQMDDEWSAESRERVEDYYEREGVNLFRRQRDLAKLTADAVDPWIDHCVVTGAPRRECSEYQLFAMCDGADLLLTYAPFMISGHVIDQIAEVLSSQTKGWLNDFIDEYLGLPPELKDWAKERPLLVV